MSDHGEPTAPLREQLLGVAGGLSTLGLVVLLAYATPRVPSQGSAGRTIFALGFLLLGGMVAGQVASMLRLPRLTGYLTAGILAGPHGVSIFGHEEVKSLANINALALALIALQAGAEFTVDMLKKGLRSLFFNSVTQVVVMVPGLLLVFMLVAGWMPFLEGKSQTAVLALGLVWAAIGVSKSPAAALAVLGESRAKGPVASFAMTMVVAFDVAVLLLFALAMMVARVLLEPGASISVRGFAVLGEELVASVAAGTTFGLLLSAWFWAVKGERMLFIVAVAYGVTAFCKYFHYDTLLVFVIAGFIVQNFSRQGPLLISTAQTLSGAVMVVFFATAGAHLDLTALQQAWQVALILFGARIFFTRLACLWGHRLANDPPTVKRFGHTSLISQAGVTIGLVTVASEKLPPELGVPLAALGIAVVGLNEMFGPVIFKWGLAKAGEIPAEAPPSTVKEHS